jgi:DNA-binding transcriptional ArsR family regulator
MRICLNAMVNPSLAEEIIQLHADICSSLADPKRILILYALSESCMNVSDLADVVGVSQPTASRHLKILRERGLVQPERQGISVVYHLRDMRLIEALDLLREVLHDRIHYRASLLENAIR